MLDRVLADAVVIFHLSFIAFAFAGDAQRLVRAVLARRRRHHDFGLARPAFFPATPGMAFDLGRAAEKPDRCRYLVRVGLEMGRVIVPAVAEGLVRLQPVA